MVTLAKDASRQTESGSLSSDETGSPEVYVRSFPEAGRPLRVSTAGGSTPAWRGDGRELFYLDLTGTLLAIESRAPFHLRFRARLSCSM